MQDKETEESNAIAIKRYRKISLSTIFSLAGLTAFALWLIRPLISQSGMPWGTDVYGHLARVWYLARAFSEGNVLTQWFPYWYNGNTLVQYYPPLATYVMVPVQYFTNDIGITYRIFVVFCILLAAFTMYKLARRWASPAWAALASAIYISAPYTLRTIFSEGHLPRVLALALTPIIFIFLFNILDKNTRRSFLWLVLMTTALILVHHQYAAVVLISVGIICLGYLVFDKEKRFNSVLTFAGMGIGIGLAACWLLPALTHADYPTVPDLSIFPERLHLYSIHWSSFLPDARSISIEEIYIGLSLVVLAVLVGVLHRCLKNWLLLFTAAICIMLAFGTNNPVYEYLPMGSFLPERFLNVAILLLVLIVVDAGNLITTMRIHVPIARLARISIFVIVIVICWLDFAPYFGFPRVARYPEVQSAIAALPASDDGSRLDVRGTPGGSEWSYFPLTMADIKLAYGWSIETTPHLASFTQHNVAIRGNFPEYILHNYALWNVRSFISGESETLLLNMLQPAGFDEISRQSGLVVLHSSRTSTPIMELGANGVAVGRGAYNTLLAFPYLTLGKNWYLEEYDIDYLSHFDLVYLYDFRYKDIHRFELLVKSLVSKGKTVILDMTNVPADTPFDIKTVYTEINPQPVFTILQESGLESEVVFEEPFGNDDSIWRGVTYDGLDAVMVSVLDESSETRPILGYKEIPEGRVYFLGLNLVGHIVDTNDKVTTEFLDSFFGMSNVYRDVYQPAFSTDSVQISTDCIEFTYSSQQDTTVVVSETWSAHWRAELDNGPLSIYNHEDLIALQLPAGTHSVIISYSMTIIQWLGWIISFIFIGLLIVAVTRFNRLASVYHRIMSWLKHMTGYVGE